MGLSNNTLVDFYFRARDLIQEDVGNPHERGNDVRLTNLRIRNFRNFEEVDIPLDNNLVLLPSPGKLGQF